MTERIGRAAATALAVAVAALLGTVACDSPPERAGPTAAPTRGTPGPAGLRAPTWSVPLPAELGRPARAGFVGATVVVQAEHGVVAVSRETGSVLWRRLAADPTDTRSAVALGAAAVVFVDRTKGEVSALDPDTGAPRVTSRGAAGVADVAVSATRLFVVTRPDPAAPGRKLTAYELGTGRVAWSRSHAGEVRIAVPGDPVGPVFARAPDALPVAALAAPAAETLVVSERTGSTWTTGTLAATTGSPSTRGTGGELDLDVGQQVAPDGSVLSWDSEAPGCPLEVAAYDPATGRRRWQGTVGRWQPTRVADEPRCGGPWYPAFAGGRLLAVTPDERPQILEAATGAVRWTGQPGAYPLELAGDALLARADHGRGDLVGYDLTTGAERWRARLAAPDRQPLSRANIEHATVGDRFVVATAVPDGASVSRRITVYAVGTGHIEWTSTGGAHLLGAGPSGVIAGQYAEPVIGEGLPTELRLYPL